MNVILLLIDTLRRDYLGTYGNSWIKTPNIDRLAAQSTVFEQAYLGSYPCMPARRDLWTGRLEFPFRGWGPLEPLETEIGALAKAAGRTSMLVTDHFHLWEKGSGNYHFSFSGVEFVRGQENDPWITDPTIPIPYPAAPEKLAKHARPGSWERYCRNTAHFKTEDDYFAPQVFQKATDWLGVNASHKDFFLVIDCFDPHEPFDPPPAYRGLYGGAYEGEQVIWPTYGPCTLSPEELAHVRNLYAAEVTMVDHHLGRMLDRLEELGLMEETCIILATDHGHMFGEHGVMGKPHSGIADSNLYQELAHLPMMVYYPGAKPRRAEGLVQLIDLFPTMCEMMELPVPDDTHGVSLLPTVLEGRQPQREIAIYGRYGEALSVTDGEWTLFLWPPGEANSPLYWYSNVPPVYGKVKLAGGLEQSSQGWRYPVEVARGKSRSALYHLPTDPQQQQNLYENEPAQVARLVAALKCYLSDIGAPLETAERLGI